MSGRSSSLLAPENGAGAVRSAKDAMLQMLGNFAVAVAPLERHSDPLERHSDPLERHSDPLERHSDPLERHSDPLERHSDAPLEDMHMHMDRSLPSETDCVFLPDNGGSVDVNVAVSQMRSTTCTSSAAVASMELDTSGFVGQLFPASGPVVTPELLPASSVDIIVPDDTELPAGGIVSSVGAPLGEADSTLGSPSQAQTRADADTDADGDFLLSPSGFLDTGDRGESELVSAPRGVPLPLPLPLALASTATSPAFHSSPAASFSLPALSRLSTDAVSMPAFGHSHFPRGRPPCADDTEAVANMHVHSLHEQRRTPLLVAAASASAGNDEHVHAMDLDLLQSAPTHSAFAALAEEDAGGAETTRTVGEIASATVLDSAMSAPLHAAHLDAPHPAVDCSLGVGVPSADSLAAFGASVCVCAPPAGSEADVAGIAEEAAAVEDGSVGGDYAAVAMPLPGYIGAPTSEPQPLPTTRSLLRPVGPLAGDTDTLLVAPLSLLQPPQQHPLQLQPVRTESSEAERPLQAQLAELSQLAAAGNPLVTQPDDDDDDDNEDDDDDDHGDAASEPAGAVVLRRNFESMRSRLRDRSALRRNFPYEIESGKRADVAFSVAVPPTPTPTPTHSHSDTLTAHENANSNSNAIANASEIDSESDLDMPVASLVRKAEARAEASRKVGANGSREREQSGFGSEDNVEEEEEEEAESESEEVGDPNKLYCVCCKPYAKGVFMIGCDGDCDGWYHGDCVGLDE